MQIRETGSQGLKKTYDVLIDAADIARATDDELKNLGQRVKIPGFRPGFVPLKVLQQRYGKNVQADVLKNVVQEAARKTIEDNKLKIALTPDVKVHDYSEGGNLTFTLTVETMPEIPEVNFRKITLEREVFDLGEDEVDRAMERLAERNP